MICARSESLLPNGMRSSSWKVTPYAPRLASSFTERTGSRAPRVASPNGSRACQPTVHRPNVNLSAGVGVTGMGSGSLSWKTGVTGEFVCVPNLPLPLRLIYPALNISRAALQREW